MEEIATAFCMGGRRCRCALQTNYANAGGKYCELCHKIAKRTEIEEMLGSRRWASSTGINARIKKGRFRAP